jgi:rhodanese-related sulfurtransferase
MAYQGDLSPSQAYELLQHDSSAVLVDVRTRAEWSYVGVPDVSATGRDAVLLEWVSFPDGALNEQFVQQLEAVAGHDAPVVFLCRSGVRSVAAAELATAAGYAAAYNVLEGFEGPPDQDGHRGRAAGWKVAGLPWKQS